MKFHGEKASILLAHDYIYGLLSSSIIYVEDTVLCGQCHSCVGGPGCVEQQDKQAIR